MADYENNTLIETQPTGPEDEGGRNFVRLAGMIAAALIVALLLIFGARWIYNAVFDNSQESGTGPADENVITPPASEEKTAPEGGTGSPAAPGQSGTPAPAQQTPRTGSTQLPNSGPGQVAALFAGSSLAGAGVHYLITSRRKDR